MKKRIHVVPAMDMSSGVWRLASYLGQEDGGVVQATLAGLEDADEVWVHGMWLPREWRACWRTLRAGKRLVRMTHGSLSPVYLQRQGKWKKRLVGPIERFFLRRADVVVATCQAEAEWIRKYESRVKKIEVTDVKRFFNLNHETHEIHEKVEGRSLHLLYLGRRHPLKGVEFLEAAVREVEGCELRIVSNAFGEEKEKVWDWCDVLVLPTLSENFGLVIAEALERGKRVITTDGAPAWGENLSRVEHVECVEGGEMLAGYGGRLIYLNGYLDGSDEKRVVLLKRAIERVCG